ncbi:hypothetical protein COOONC_08755 [Cooperia oncophora]
MFLLTNNGLLFTGRASSGSVARGGGVASTSRNSGGQPGQPGGGFPQQGGVRFHPTSSIQRRFAPESRWISTARPTRAFPSANFRPGSGVGSSASSGMFKKALIGGAIGAVGGLVAYEAGKAIIKSATAPFTRWAQLLLGQSLPTKTQ